ncbi:hypothetical protein IWW55_007068, partial [Coemansia sp. RSA 2706]
MGNRLSFSLTASEQRRVEMGRLMGERVDARGLGDGIMVVVIAVVYFIDVLAA